MRNLALFLKYDGTAYHGWQVQTNACSVAQTLEEAAADVVGHPVHMTGCGRTDEESSAFYFFFSPCPTNRSTAITAPYRIPAIAQMNQLYFACALPYGPKV